MSVYSSRLDLPAAFAEPVRCPRCGASALAPTADGGVLRYRCAACGACWRDELGWLSRVDPDDCVDCPHREECRAAAGDGER